MIGSIKFAKHISHLPGAPLTITNTHRKTERKPKGMGYQISSRYPISEAIEYYMGDSDSEGED